MRDQRKIEIGIGNYGYEVVEHQNNEPSEPERTSEEARQTWQCSQEQGTLNDMKRPISRGNLTPISMNGVVGEEDLTFFPFVDFVTLSFNIPTNL